MRKSTKILVGVIVIVAMLSIGIVTHNLGYITGEKTGYDNGYSKGYDLGKVNGHLQGYSEGYENGTIDGAGTGYNIRDPTYSEMKTFIESDTTNQHTWTESYTCFNFCNDVITHAYSQGIRVGFVYIAYYDDTSHAIICFDTTDRGIVYVEPQTDEIIPLSTNTVYPIGSPYEFYAMIEYFTIIW